MKILAACLLASISTPVLPANIQSTAPQTKVVASNSCLITGDTTGQGQGFFAAAAAILAPIVVELVIDAVSTDLKKVRTKTSAGELDFDLYEKSAKSILPISKQPTCITILTGIFEDPSGSMPPSIVAKTKVQKGAGKEVVLQRLSENGIKAREIYSILEVQTEMSSDETAFAYKPAFAKVYGLMPGHSAKKQGLVFNLSMRGPGASPNGTVYSQAPISLGEVGVGFEIHQDDSAQASKIEKLRTGYLLVPGMSELSYRAFVSDLLAKKQVGSYMPVSFKAEVVQTVKPTDAALVLASILEKAKPKLSEAAGKAATREDPFKVSQTKLDAEIAVAQAALDLETATGENNAAKIALAKLKKKKAEEALAELE